MLKEEKKHCQPIFYASIDAMADMLDLAVRFSQSSLDRPRFAIADVRNMSYHVHFPRSHHGRGRDHHDHVLHPSMIRLPQRRELVPRSRRACCEEEACLLS
jgi:hypothetical protein